MNTTIRLTKASTAISSFLKERKALLVLGTMAGVTALAQPAYADITVCASGCNQMSIQAAIDASPDGGIIRIRPGIYQEILAIRDKALRLVGAGSAVTVIDGTGPYTPERVISLNCATVKKIAIDGLTFTGGNAGGLENLGCKVSLDNSLVTGNSGRRYGPKDGVYNNGIMTIWNTVVSDNVGGIGNDGTLEISNSSIIDNGPWGISNYGTLSGSNVTVANTRGRGIGTYGSGTLTGYRIYANAAETSLPPADLGRVVTGAGVSNEGDLLLRYSLVLSNTGTGKDGAKGGGIYNGSGSLKLVGDIVTRNLAAPGTYTDGGGLFNAGGTVSLTEGTAIVNNIPNNCNDTTCP